ncbi:MAG: Fic family protein [Candidatus Altiarchaeota archaeon]|nr:Fic family protein [Candidatus Altiarchaeota archaeon]
MVYLKEKVINGGKYKYLTKSIRLPDGKVKTIQKLVKDSKSPVKELERKHLDYFVGKEKELYTNFALKKYEIDPIFTKVQIEKIEHIKVDYQHTLKSFSKEQYSDVFDRFIANFTYESNAIEGNSLTLKDVAVVMFEDKAIEGKELREIYETKNSRTVMDLMLKNKFGITEKDIMRMHKILMQNIDSRTGYKKFPNHIIGSGVKLTPPEKVKEEMGELIEWYDESLQSMHPLKVSALLHGKFERIHPFADGNGRVGRFLSNIILMEHKYPPLIIRKTQRSSYIKCLQDFHRGYTPNMERFFLEKYKKTYRKFFAVYLKYIR